MISDEDIAARIKWWTDQKEPDKKGLFSVLFGKK